MLRHSGSIAIIFVLGGLLTVGCDSGDQKAQQPGPTTAPASQPATTEPSIPAEPTTAPATQPAASVLTVDGQPVKFPPARLRVSQVNGRVVARLYTADPKSALSDDYKGNSFDMVLNLDDINQPQMVYTAQWQFKARSREFIDSPYGIFLEGMRHQLQPVDVSAKFLGDMFLVRVDLEGQFVQSDSADPAGAPKTVYVKGSLLAPVEYNDR